MGTTKAKTATNGTPESVMNAGADAVKNGFEKVAKNYDTMTEFSKENFEAVIESANAVTKGFESIQSETLAFSRQNWEDGVSAFKAAITAKTPQEFFEVNSDYTKSFFDAYLGQMTKFGDMFASTTRESMEPLNGRFNALVEVVQSQRS